MFQEFPYIAAFLGGALSFLSPCVLPLVPGYLSYIAGIRMEDAHSEDKAIKKKMFFSALLFVAGFSLIFIALGAGASGIAPLLASYQDILTKIAGIFIIILGLHVFGLFKISFLYRELRLNPEIDEMRSVLTPFILGLAFGLGWTPCIGPILAGVLVLASNQNTVAEGMGLLSLYAAGMGIPFLLAAVAMSKFQAKSGFFKRHLGVIEKIAGVFLIVTGLFIFLGELQSFGTLLLDYLPFLSDLG
ncbi:MAG: cytochrome c-type biogenesis protein [Alphaproteobacteria bacterium]|jgi:cytochrome c-type biogenesis protein